MLTRWSGGKSLTSPKVIWGRKLFLLRPITGPEEEPLMRTSAFGAVGLLLALRYAVSFLTNIIHVVTSTQQFHLRIVLESWASGSKGKPHISWFHFSFKISNLPLSSQISNLHSSDWSRLTNKNKNSALNKILLSGEVFWIAGSYFYERVPWSRDEYACCNLLKQSVLVIIRHSIQILRQD